MNSPVLELTDLMFQNFQGKFALGLHAFLSLATINNIDQTKHLLIGLLINMFNADPIVERNSIIGGFLSSLNQDRLFLAVIQEKKRSNTQLMNLFAFYLKNIDYSSNFIYVSSETYNNFRSKLKNNFPAILLPVSGPKAIKVHTVEFCTDNFQILPVANIKTLSIDLLNTDVENFLQISRDDGIFKTFNKISSLNNPLNPNLPFGSGYFKRSIEQFFEISAAFGLDESVDGIYRFIIGGLLNWRAKLSFVIYLRFNTEIYNMNHQEVFRDIYDMTIVAKGYKGKILDKFILPTVIGISRDKNYRNLHKPANLEIFIPQSKCELNICHVVYFTISESGNKPYLTTRNYKKVDIFPTIKDENFAQRLFKACDDYQTKNFLTREISVNLGQPASIENLVTNFYAELSFKTPNIENDFLFIDRSIKTNFGDYIFLLDNGKLTVIVNISNRKIDQEQFKELIYLNLPKIAKSGKYCFVFVSSSEENDRFTLTVTDFLTDHLLEQQSSNSKIDITAWQNKYCIKNAKSTDLIKLSIDRKPIPISNLFSQFFDHKSILPASQQINYIIYAMVQTAHSFLSFESSKQMAKLLQNILSRFVNIFPHAQDETLFKIVFERKDSRRKISTWKKIQYLNEIGNHKSGLSTDSENPLMIPKKIELIEIKQDENDLWKLQMTTCWQHL